MEIPKIIKIVLLIVILMYGIFKFFLRKKDDRNSDFFTIEDQRNNRLLINPSIQNSVLEEVKAKYADMDYDRFDNLFFAYSELLLDPLWDLSEATDEEDYFNKLNKSQRIFSILMQMDGQINNGGVYQFLWNRPESMHAAREALFELEIQPLANDFAVVIQELEQHVDDYIEDKKIWDNSKLSHEVKWKRFTDGRAVYSYGQEDRRILLLPMNFRKAFEI